MKQINIPKLPKGKAPEVLSTFDLIRQFLSDSKGKPRKTFVPGGDIERFVGARHFSKQSTIGRNLRDMAQNGELEVTYYKKAPRFVMYRLK